jgi:hypothetical protein
MMPSSGTCFHASITYLLAKFAEVVHCHLVSELRADESVKLVSEWDNTIVTGTLNMGLFAEVASVVVFSAPRAVLFACLVGVIFGYLANEAVIWPLALAFVGMHEGDLALAIVWRATGPFIRSWASCEQRSVVQSGGRRTGSTDGWWHLDGVVEGLHADSGGATGSNEVVGRGEVLLLCVQNLGLQFSVSLVFLVSFVSPIPEPVDFSIEPHVTQLSQCMVNEGSAFEGRVEYC